MSPGPAVPALDIALGQATAAGAGGRNQDFHGAVLPAGLQRQRKGIALAMADGIGSSAVGHVASAAAVRSFLDDYLDTADSWPVRRAAQCVLQAANAWLHAQTQAGEGRHDQDRGHVCSFSALVLKGREGHVLHVGDARLYRVHPQALEPLTELHRTRLDDGRRLLSRALGVSARVEIDYRRWPLEVGEVYLLATDGAWEHLDAAEVRAALAAHPDDLQAAAGRLVARAAARGSDDDRSVQLLRIESLPASDAPNAGAPRLPLPPPLAPRARFEGYRVVRELAVSARSHVYLAVDEASGQSVALKLPALTLRSDEDALDRFALEEWVARRVDSAHVLKAAGLAEAADATAAAAAAGTAGTAVRPRQHLYVAMEYVDGCSLRQWMRDHPAPGLAAVRGLVEQAAAGLQALHRRAVLHGDLRPENLLIDATGTLRLIDFGSVQVAGLVEGRSMPARPVGSLQYTAPEVFVGAGAVEASEQFALAVLTYEMLTGQLPYGLTVPRLRSAHELSGLRYVPLRTHRPDLPAWVDAALRRALHPLPQRRHEALSAYVQALAAPPGDGRDARPSPWIDRDPTRFWRALSCALAVVVVVLVALRVLGR